jgi:3-hydroxybutyrate dehydrogenase
MKFTGKTVLVTGAASGIGKAIAEAFAEAGATVLLNDVRDEGKDVADEIDAAFLQADLADPEEVRRLAREALHAAGRVDILVNNAGFQHVAPVEEFPEDVWIRMIHVMLIAPFQLMKHLVPGMKEQKWGRIINICSVHGVVASPYKTPYVSAKHGMIGLTKTVALEVAESGITVNAICPAFVRTPIVDSQIKSQAKLNEISEDEVIEKVILAPAAIKRLIEPEEVAGFALFLASGAGGAFTGSAQLMDLGWSAR